MGQFEIGDIVIITECDWLLGYTGKITAISKQIFGDNHLFYVYVNQGKIGGGEYYANEIQLLNKKNIMEELKKKLSKYGKVIACDNFGDNINIVITDGFSSKAINTLECMKVITDSLPDYPVLENARTDDNFFSLGLRKTK